MLKFLILFRLVTDNAKKDGVMNALLICVFYPNIHDVLTLVFIRKKPTKHLNSSPLAESSLSGQYSIREGYIGREMIA